MSEAYECYGETLRLLGATDEECGRMVEDFRARVEKAKIGDDFVDLYLSAGMQYLALVEQGDRLAVLKEYGMSPEVSALQSVLARCERVNGSLAGYAAVLDGRRNGVGNMEEWLLLVESGEAFDEGLSATLLTDKVCEVLYRSPVRFGPKCLSNEVDVLRAETIDEYVGSVEVVFDSQVVGDLVEEVVQAPVLLTGTDVLLVVEADTQHRQAKRVLNKVVGGKHVRVVTLDGLSKVQTERLWYIGSDAGVDKLRGVEGVQLVLRIAVDYAGKGFSPLALYDFALRPAGSCAVWSRGSLSASMLSGHGFYVLDEHFELGTRCYGSATGLEVFRVAVGDAVWALRQSGSVVLLDAFGCVLAVVGERSYVLCGDVGSCCVAEDGVPKRVETGGLHGLQGTTSRERGKWVEIVGELPRDFPDGSCVVVQSRHEAIYWARKYERDGVRVPVLGPEDLLACDYAIVWWKATGVIVRDKVQHSFVLDTPGNHVRWVVPGLFDGETRGAEFMGDRYRARTVNAVARLCVA